VTTAEQAAFFSGVLASGYDALYRGRDVDAEVKLVLERAGGWLGRDKLNVLDLGCGTGQHIEALARRGHRAVGVDVSPALVVLARERNPDARIEVADLQTFALGERFDLAVALFGVFDYLWSLEQVRAGLRSTALHLRRDGVLYMVVSRAGAMTPDWRFVEVELDDGTRLLRWTKPSDYDADSGIVKLTYEFLLLDDDRVVARHQETHVMRGWTTTELRLFLGEAGFRVEAVTAQGATFHALARRT
jgi:SAM-dependent methyltransferase